MIDLRSDTVTKPTPSMQLAMSNATVGDDVYGEDPTVNKLERLAADMLGFESALYASSGTQTNLLALLSHCERGDEYIVAQEAHTYKYEGGGAAIFGSIVPQPIDARADGTLAFDSIERVIKADDIHFAKTKLVALENTFGGRALPQAYLAAAREFVDSRGLALHLDGARIFNAAVHHGVSVQAISGYFDSVSVCLSKGLCAPVGSVLCGSTELITRARRWRKVLGGGMRQAGYIAAAGIVALTENTERLADDHSNAEQLADLLRDIGELKVTEDSPRTNMVFLDCGITLAQQLARALADKGILISAASSVRMVLHNDIANSDVRKIAAAVRNSGVLS